MQNSSFTHMDTVTCKKCHQTLFVSSYTTAIRCRECEETISVGDIQEPVSFGMTKWQSQDEDNITTEGKGVISFYKKISSNISPKTSLTFNPCPSARISIAPPRGKRAFLCGVSYKNKKFKLKGTTQDVMNMANLLIQKFSFPANAILILAEDITYEPPTKNNILQAFEWLTKGLQEKDSLVFYFSGHGLRQLEFEGDEVDGFDEAICPLDFETEGLIIDNDINKIIVGPLKKDVKLHAIIDACHSGTVVDLPYVFDRDKRIWNSNHPPSGVFKGTSGGLAISFSACEDHQQAADTSAFSPERTMAGAMTHNFIKAITNIPNITYLGILDYMHNAIQDANNYQGKCHATGLLIRLFQRKMLQDPLLSSSEGFNVNRVFEL